MMLALLLLLGGLAEPWVDVIEYHAVQGGVGCSAVCHVPEADGGQRGPGFGRVEATSQTSEGCRLELQAQCRQRAVDHAPKEKPR